MDSRTPDELASENALICEKLLGWKRNEHNGTVWWVEESSLAYAPTHFVVPPFVDWTDAGLLLDELQKRSYDARGAADVLLELGDKLIGALLTPAAIRVATLKYVRSLP
jgi:hypothetical protein